MLKNYSTSEVVEAIRKAVVELEEREEKKMNKQETIRYFKYLSYEYEREAVRSNDATEKIRAEAKAEAYELAAFELEKNMK